MLLIDPLFLTVSISSTGSSLDKSIDTESTGKTNNNIDNNKVSSTPQTVDSQGILNLFYLRCIILLNTYYNFVKCILLIGLLSPTTSSSSSSVVSQGILFYFIYFVFYFI